VPWYARYREITFVRIGSPRSFQYWRASLIAVSTASPPDGVKKTRFRSPGAAVASRSASVTAGSCGSPHTGKYASRSAWARPASASSARPWPTCTVNKPANPSR
jgi:hypothetical protein